MRKIKHINFSEYILYTFIIIFSAQSANFLENKIFIVLFFSYVCILYFIKYKTIDRPVILILNVWIAINVIALLFFGNVPGVKLITFLSVTARIIYPYFVLKLVGKKMFSDLEQIIYGLAIISLPIFMLQLLFPSFFYSMAPYLNMFTIEEQQVNGGWYVGFYMFSGWGADRNCGFMWEPGAFAFMIVLGTFFRLAQNNMRLDHHIVVYAVAIITTFSTMGYIVFFYIIMAKYLQTKKIYIYAPILCLFLFFSYIQFWQVEFLGPKIEKYYESMDTIYRSSELSGGILRVNRFAILDLAFQEFKKWPLGYGVFEASPFYIQYGEKISGPNTYAQILLRWGIVGIIFFFLAIYKFINQEFCKENIFVRIFLIFAMLSSVFSYGLINNSILLAILYYPFIKDKIKEGNYENNSHYRRIRFVW